MISIIWYRNPCPLLLYVGQTEEWMYGRSSALARTSLWARSSTIIKRGRKKKRRVLSIFLVHPPTRGRGVGSRGGWGQTGDLPRTPTAHSNNLMLILIFLSTYCSWVVELRRETYLDKQFTAGKEDQGTNMQVQCGRGIVVEKEYH